jgi:hypothetical protein
MISFILVSDPSASCGFLARPIRENPAYLLAMVYSKERTPDPAKGLKIDIDRLRFINVASYQARHAGQTIRARNLER